MWKARLASGGIGLARVFYVLIWKRGIDGGMAAALIGIVQIRYYLPLHRAHQTPVQIQTDRPYPCSDAPAPAAGYAKNPAVYASCCRNADK